MLPYDEYGSKDKPLIIFLHGALATDSFCMQYALQSDFHIVVPHLYGSGRSVDKTFSYAAMLPELVQLLQQFGEKCIVAGHSLGANLALELTCKHPELIERAVFLSPCLFMTDKLERTYKRFAKLTCAMLKWSWLIKLQARYWHFTERQGELLAEYAAKVTPEQYAAFYADMPHLDDLPEYANIQIPMLTMCGAGELKAVRKSVRALQASNASCQAMELKHANHAFPMRAYRRLNPILRMFMADAAIESQHTSVVPSAEPSISL